jgi:hypothetical protein
MLTLPTSGALERGILRRVTIGFDVAALRASSAGHAYKIGAAETDLKCGRRCRSPPERLRDDPSYVCATHLIIPYQRL